MNACFTKAWKKAEQDHARDAVVIRAMRWTEVGLVMERMMEAVARDLRTMPGAPSKKRRRR